ncbi:centromere protein Q isoform X3 [Narcine bancroftii]|uniref:centromere protein Q isoform X3 n=2 Tax=Narcine bancroftii TaxID=1343680 RepID=UPI0038322657
MQRVLAIPHLKKASPAPAEQEAGVEHRSGISGRENVREMAGRNATSAKKKARESGGREGERPAKRCKKMASNPRNATHRTVKVGPAKLARWRPLSKTVQEFITSAIEAAILSSLPHEASHHVPYLEILEQLKNRLNDRCSDLLAPPAKVGHPRDCHKMLAQEKEHLVEGEAALRTLQEELDRTLEKLDCDRDEAEGLQERIRQLKDIVEEANHRGVQDVPSGCLNLPSLPPDSFLPISLQDRLETLENPARILAELESLGRCGELQDLCTFLERAYAQVDGF